MNLHAAKIEARRAAKARRAALDAAERADRSQQIVGLLRPLAADSAVVADSAFVMVYSAIGDELDLSELTAELAGEDRLLLPRVEHGRIVAVAHRAGGELVHSRFGVPEPTGPAVDPADIGVVFVPGLAFDLGRGRLGYGAGYYDRFLAQPELSARTIGVAFDAQVVERLPIEAHDRQMNVVITESRRIGAIDDVEVDARPHP